MTSSTGCRRCSPAATSPASSTPGRACGMPPSPMPRPRSSLSSPGASTSPPCPPPSPSTCHTSAHRRSELGYRNAVRLAEATAEAGSELIISAEGSGRTDLVLDTHARLCRSFDHVGITLQARLHRTPGDLAALLQRPGRVRLVKGAFLEPESVAFRATAPALRDAYLSLADIADHERPRAVDRHARRRHSRHAAEHSGSALAAPHVEFEMLLGLAPRPWTSCTRPDCAPGST